MRCSDCKKFKTSECEINPSGEDHESVEKLDCFVPRDYGEIDRDTSAKVSPISEVSEKTMSPDEIKRIYEEENTKLEALEDKQKQGVITKKRVVIMTMLWLLLFVIMIATDTCPLIDTRSELEKFQDTWGDLYDLEGDAE